ncbi:MAG TPA: hypothetical protein PKM63_08955 [Panacibacter sp.]|nr:hypothetical protein [Panacibacter sp.]HNP44398.1 hypothetical protein [Panacibacter sp.]
MMAIFQYLFYSILLETPLVMLFYRREWKNVIPVEILLNSFTWPILSLLYFMYPHSLLQFEAGVVIAEAAAFKVFFEGSWIKALLASFSANATSLLAGVWINHLSIF